ncbi:MAG: energy transducer TonB [Pseudomonadota bacterium]|nr:energy transducer TonB [Pseudomonadota bacterium]
MNCHGLKWFIVLSAAVHAAVLFYWTPPAREIGNPGRVLQLAMTDISGETATAAAGIARSDNQESTPEATVAKTRSLPVKPVYDTATQPVPNRIPEATEASDPDPPPPEQQESSAQTSLTSGSPDDIRQDTDHHLRMSILELVTAQLKYPTIARRRGWQGIVILELHIESDGHISRLHVTETSGYPVLDQAAISSLQLASVPHAGQWLNGHAIDIMVPVEYRLTGG